MEKKKVGNKKVGKMTKMEKKNVGKMTKMEKKKVGKWKRIMTTCGVEVYLK